MFFLEKMYGKCNVTNDNITEDVKVQEAYYNESFGISAVKALDLSMGHEHFWCIRVMNSALKRRMLQRVISCASYAAIP